MKKTYIPMNNEETIEVTEEPVEVVEKEESKMKGFVKNNWKKFAVGAGIVLAGVGGFLLGSNTTEVEDDLELLDASDVDVESSEE